MSLFRTRALELWSAFSLYRLTAAQRARRLHDHAHPDPASRHHRIRPDSLYRGREVSHAREIARRQRQIARGVVRSNAEGVARWLDVRRKRVPHLVIFASHDALYVENRLLMNGVPQKDAQRLREAWLAKRLSRLPHHD